MLKTSCFRGGSRRKTRVLSYRLLLWGIERVHGTDYLIGIEKKFPDWWIRITFLGRIEKSLRLSIKNLLLVNGLEPKWLHFGQWFSLSVYLKWCTYFFFFHLLVSLNLFFENVHNYPHSFILVAFNNLLMQMNF